MMVMVGDGVIDFEVKIFGGVDIVVGYGGV